MTFAENLAKKYNAMIDCGPDYGMQPDCRAVAAINAAIEEAAKVADRWAREADEKIDGATGMAYIVGRIKASHAASIANDIRRNLKEGE
jgi:hypothetical protein